MFCHKCGGKLKENSKTCPECGAPVSGNEYCGGFWGLAGKNVSKSKEGSRIESRRESMELPKKRKDDNGNSPYIEELEKKLYEVNQNSEKRFRFLFIACVVLLVLVLVQAILVFGISGRIGSMEKAFSETQNVEEITTDFEETGSTEGESTDNNMVESDSSENENWQNTPEPTQEETTPAVMNNTETENNTQPVQDKTEPSADNNIIDNGINGSVVQNDEAETQVQPEGNGKPNNQIEREVSEGVLPQ